MVSAENQRQIKWVVHQDIKGRIDRYRRVVLAKDRPLARGLLHADGSAVERSEAAPRIRVRRDEDHGLRVAVRQGIVNDGVVVRSVTGGGGMNKDIGPRFVRAAPPPDAGRGKKNRQNLAQEKKSTRVSGGETPPHAHACRTATWPPVHSPSIFPHTVPVGF